MASPLTPILGAPLVALWGKAGPAEGANESVPTRLGHHQKLVVMKHTFSIPTLAISRADLLLIALFSFLPRLYT